MAASRAVGLPLPAQLVGRTLELVSLFALYGTIAHGVQRFRTFQLVAGVLAATCLFIALVCFHQGLSDKQCVAGEESAGDITGNTAIAEAATSGKRAAEALIGKLL